MINVDFNNVNGKIKPMHAVNNMPFVPYNLGPVDLYAKMEQAGIPYARLHDTGGEYGGSHYVDIPNVFPDFDADENDPASYDFAFTDVLIKGMVERGIKPFYRLGVTIENHVGIKSYNIFPPKDFEKWARICEGIIRHYNEGFADGFHFNIEYWEIWNEPDNYPEIKDNCMWKGTKEQYFELYRTASSYLKSRFPKLKIGGYASCGFYQLSNTDVSETAHSSSRTEYFVEFFHDFMKYIRKNNLALDFFSWHSYDNVKNNMNYAFYVREQLDKYGYHNTEIIFNEWNPGTQDRGTQKDAAQIEAMMIGMQKTPTDMCMYYDAAVRSEYCGLFNPINFTVFKAYFAFSMFNVLYTLGNSVECNSDDENVFVCAAADKGQQAVVVVNCSPSPITTEINIKGAENNLKFFAVSSENNSDAVEKDLNRFEMDAYEICLITFEH